ncbi:hypothetical protein M5D96_010072 [Drosophila gunungcola]|uniref:Uncharacterized protein n=1 Tax=Drosophila gunungcola TaxID=103775 RepID=A0A9P9YIB5_9MUSC|nr:hypothetical protein M5D96_010072 [Drosophila gunungcola]
MEETVCLPGNKMPRRKSFFPSSSRKSMIPHRISSVQEENEKEEEEVAMVEEETAPAPLALPQTAVAAQLPVVSEQKVEPNIKIFEDSIASPDHFAVAGSSCSQNRDL